VLRPRLLFAPLFFLLGTARGVGFDQYLFERLDEALRVGAEAFMREPDGVAARETLQALRQIRRARHLGVVDQDRDYALLLLKRRLDLDAHEVFRIVEAPPARLVGGEPALADHRDQHVAACDLVAQHLHEVVAGRDIVDVHEQAFRRKGLLKPAKQGLGEARVVVAAIVDEDISGHSPCPSSHTAGAKLAQSGDCRHAGQCRRQARHAPEAVVDTVWDKYVWTIYDAGSGERLGQVKSHVRYAPFFVTGTLLVMTTGPGLRHTGQGLVEEPLQMKAFDLTTGQVAWTQPIRDTANRLPPPP
jgi:hypothetical protein